MYGKRRNYTPQIGDKVKYYQINHDGDLATITGTSTKDGRPTYDLEMADGVNCKPWDKGKDLHWAYPDQIEPA